MEQVGNTSVMATLNALSGAWTGTGCLHASEWGPASTTTGQWTFRMDPSGHHLIGDYREHRHGGGSFFGHGVMTFAPEDGRILWFWFDSLGMPPLEPASGLWDGGRLTLLKTTPRGTGRITFLLIDEAFEFTTEARMSDVNEFAMISSSSFVRA
jgi:hypothetical protein